MDQLAFSNFEGLHPIEAMESEKEILVYEQTASDVKWMMIVFTIIMVIFTFTAPGHQKWVFIVVYLWISSMVWIIWKTIAIRRIEFHSDKIVILYPLRGYKTLHKEDIRDISIYRSWSGRLRTQSTNFRFNLHKNHFIPPYGNMLIINNYLFGDDPSGEKVKELLEFLKSHYSDKISSIEL